MNTDGGVLVVGCWTDEDRSDNWLDSFNNAPLLAAFVTRVDDPVKQFAGFISE
jgi:hypothetical protein